MGGLVGRSTALIIGFNDHFGAWFIQAKAQSLQRQAVVPPASTVHSVAGGTRGAVEGSPLTSVAAHHAQPIRVPSSALAAAIGRRVSALGASHAQAGHSLLEALLKHHVPLVTCSLLALS